MEETGEPGQEKQDARPRCPPLLFEEGVVGWKMGARGRGWELGGGQCVHLEGVGGPWAPGKRGAVGPQGLRDQGSAPSLASETFLVGR